MYDEADYLMISGIQHFLFCRRQWALIHIEQQWEENHLTVEGEYIHKRVDQPQIKEKRGEKITIRGMRIHSPELGLTGICDAVELIEDAQGIALAGYAGRYRVLPIEYKHGKKKYDQSDEMQLIAQIVCLEEMMATEIPYGEIFYHETRKRVQLEATAEKRRKLAESVGEMHDYFARRFTPKVKPSPKCKKCSLQEICLPTLAVKQKVSTYLSRKLAE
ncbi:MAG: CRISPR-associated protein Cas4 [Enterococcaceae bacterium]|jgi:CRISPR-associated exonuclease Cas4|nr:CRISPR-associated protein Cas4 [Enterococcaceae bacterium]